MTLAVGDPTKCFTSSFCRAYPLIRSLTHNHLIKHVSILFGSLNSHSTNHYVTRNTMTRPRMSHPCHASRFLRVATRSSWPQRCDMATPANNIAQLSKNPIKNKRRAERKDKHKTEASRGEEGVGRNRKWCIRFNASWSFQDVGRIS